MTQHFCSSQIIDLANTPKVTIDPRRQFDDHLNTLYHIRVMRVQGIEMSSLGVQVGLFSAESTIESSDPDLLLLTMFAVDDLAGVAVCSWQVCF